MTSKQIKLSERSRNNGKIKQFLVSNLRPTLFEGTMAQYKLRLVAGNRSKPRVFTSAFLESLKANGALWLVRTGAAFGITAGPNYLYGVRSWDPGFDKGAQRMIVDSGPVAKWITEKAISYTAFASLAPDKMVSLANTMLAVEFSMCAIRMLAEQIAWRKTKFSGEVAGTGAAPLMAFIGESIVKTVEKYPADPLKRFIIATRGIWGNFVRIVHSSLIIGFGNRLWNAIKPKPPPGPRRNEFGFPIRDDTEK
jgi:hypothetical protein